VQGVVSKEEASRLLADLIFCYYDTATFKVSFFFCKEEASRLFAALIFSYYDTATFKVSFGV